MFDEWVRHWGADEALKLGQTLASEPPLSLRCNRKMPAADLLKELKAGDALPVKASLSELSPSGVVLSGYMPVMKSESYEKGSYEIQDEGSQRMSYFALWPELFGSVLTPRPGVVEAAPLPKLPTKVAAWTVVDACAGAGGKTLAMADALMGKGRVYAYDTSVKKLEALRRRARRAGVNNTQSVAVESGNEGATVKRFARTADVVLVDAPCTGWGVLRRNPDIKWRQTAETLTKMPEIQERLLAEYAQLVRPGGRLVFGVCTFRPQETTDIAARFVAAHPDFKLERGGYLGPGPCDGFFMQSFVR
jgi:16S rRNA (cytosine967-C5)-methyltransferase